MIVRRLAALAAVTVLAAACNSDDSTSGDTIDPADAAVSEPPPTEPPPTEPPPTEPPPTEPPPTEPPPTSSEPPPAAGVAQWVPFDGGPDCRCADGSEVDFLERAADPTKVVLYFEGGGACFTAETCVFEGQEGNTYTSSSRITPEQMAGRGGIFDAENPENPVADHSFVYVPYCTGDVHLGNATTEYSDELTVHHNGYVNGRAALDHLVATYPDVTELVVTGSSAGSVPPPLYAGLASDALPDARIVTLGDSSGAYPSLPGLNAAIGSLWGTENAIPDWPVNADLAIEEWGIPDLYVRAGSHAPDLTFGKFDFAFDDVQVFFAGLAGIPADDLVSLIDSNEAMVEAEGVDVASYVAPGTGHTILSSDEFYTLDVEGIRLVDWFGELVDVTSPPPPDVHCAECT